MKTKSIIVVFFVVSISPAYALGILGFEELGLYGPNQAMGGAGAAGAEDGSALFLNPAGLSQRRQYTLSGILGFHPDAQWGGGAALDTSSSPLGLGVDYRFFREAPRREHFLHVGVSEYYLDTLYFGISYRHHWFWDPGFGEYRDFPAFGLGIIIPLAYFRLGVAALDQLPRRDPYGDPRLAAGLALRVFWFTLLLDGIYHQEGKVWELAGGGELNLWNIGFFRGGYRYDLEHSLHSLHLGGGVKLGEVLHGDYAFTRLPGKRSQHTLSLELILF